MTKDQKLRALTRLQQVAIVALLETAQVGWTRGDRFDGATRRSLSTLIPWGLVEGKEVRSARRTDYRLTDQGRATADPIAARFARASSAKAARLGAAA